jgi:hypothetical protein
VLVFDDEDTGRLQRLRLRDVSNQDFPVAASAIEKRHFDALADVRPLFHWRDSRVPMPTLWPPLATHNGN